ncbi:glucose 1-dehydrogenase [Planosporangium sp. 12N6]|uniref:glucose 1-dehydrogenase n=1 Tax=Planosporangium spinosum TaxID=3402278 RepID=UPI003CFB6511
MTEEFLLPGGPPLSGKAALVTGGSRGIGRAVVERLAHDGAHVVFGYHGNHPAAKDVERAVDAAGGRASGFQADLGRPDEVRALLSYAEERLGGLDILVNNAGAAFTPTPIAETSDEEYERVMAVNTRAVFLLLRYAARHMRDGGRIITMSTLNTVMPTPGGALYTASKGAIEQLTTVAARELGPRGITVNTVSPGATDTDLLRATNPEEALHLVVRMTPLGRLGQPADIADVVAFLAGPDARWLTGQNIHATGGIA